MQSSDSQVQATATGLTGSSIYACSVRVEKSPPGDLNTAEGLTWCSGTYYITRLASEDGAIKRNAPENDDGNLCSWHIILLRQKA